MSVYEIIAADMQSFKARKDSIPYIDILFEECTLEEMLSLLEADKKLINSIKSHVVSSSPVWGVIIPLGE